MSLSRLLTHLLTNENPRSKRISLAHAIIQLNLFSSFYMYVVYFNDFDWYFGNMTIKYKIHTSKIPFHCCPYLNYASQVIGFTIVLQINLLYDLFATGLAILDVDVSKRWNKIKPSISALAADYSDETNNYPTIPVTQTHFTSSVFLWLTELLAILNYLFLKLLAKFLVLF